MEFLERIGALFSSLLLGVERFITRLFGSSNDRRVRQIGFVREKDGSSVVTPGSTLDRINQLEPTYEKLTDEELKGTAAKLRAQIAHGKTLDDVLPEAFAAVREAGKRYLKMRHYDVQMVGGYILNQGMIAEMVTGEGKTLVATPAAFLNGLVGSVHVITVNDYLARRDMEWMGPLYMGLGLTVGAIQSNMSPAERQREYACDITYGTNNEFGFDYLRDNMKPTAALQVQKTLTYAIVDEIDNILIDEARTPLIISGPAHDDLTKYPRAQKVALQLKPGEHFEIKEKEHTCHLTEAGIRAAEELAGVDSFYTVGNMEWPHLIDNSLRAIHLYKRDVNYIVERNEIIIIDEHTGRKMEGRQWSDGLHQAVETKEGVKIKEESQTLATITLQNFFKLYKKLSGMTGTAMTEANEFWKIYKLDVVAVPTNRPMQRINHTDAIYRTMREKWEAVIDEVKEVHETGRPVLVGTVSIESSEHLSDKLKRRGIPHNVLNAKNHEREAEIVAQAGRHNAVTIATNMAGRGTDIILGGNPEYLAWNELKQKYASRLDVSKAEWDEVTDRIKEQEGMAAEGRKVAELGGLHVVGTERHDSRRIDLQLRGRAARQGDPGSGRFFLSLEDDLMRKFAGDWVKDWLARLGMQDGERIESGLVSKQIEGAQKKVEERHFEMRKHLLEYDEVMDEQRKRVYTYRQAVLEGANCRERILEMIDRQLARWTKHFFRDSYRWETCAGWATTTYAIDVDASDVKGMDAERMAEYLRDQAERQAEAQIREQIEENLPEDADDRDRNWSAMSRWVNNHFGLNTNDRELRKFSLADLEIDLYERARGAIAKYDFSPLATFLDPKWSQQSMASWTSSQFGVTAPAELFAGADADSAAAIVRGKIDETYRNKAIEFPVAVGMTNFMQERADGAHRYDRTGLLNWANGRFAARLDVAEHGESARHELERLLMEGSRQFLSKGDSIHQLDERLDRAFASERGLSNGAANGHLSSRSLAELLGWASHEFQASLSPDELKHADRSTLRTRVLREYESRYRPELDQTERSLILETLDTAWKDHLYYMDHLRSGIGLVGYAQKDPKVEYRREGMRAFEQMWDRIGEQVTSAIFRVEKLSPEFVGGLWEVTSVTHAAPPSIEADNGSSNMPEPGAPDKAIDPIRNFGERVGRNDPCPCGSGKKYKKCHGVDAL